MKFSTFLIAASAAVVSARPSLVSTFGAERAALANETAPIATPGLEDGREEEDREELDQEKEKEKERQEQERADREREERERQQREQEDRDREQEEKDREDRDREEDRKDDRKEDRKDGELAFGQVDLNYLLKVNELDLVKLQTLSIKNNFDVNVFSDLFAADEFSIKSLLELQQLSTMLAIAETGIFDQFELSGLQLGGLNLGLIDGIGGLDLTQFIDAAARPKITVIAKQVVKVKNTVVLNHKN
ncbi:uncharacterized protein FIESC28_10676 [Fusarium coffeatum]|uniref:Uncharacterized protein n=1 Tax=Fusarium coffeatum TaxID=231269 RepID=A0A366QTX7_9HYPO|nr:uncharacterized protein FIESC28_10676 [Fusarium coffeatum]RBR07435.1 hypothetical protein FIESC28_10676 [Fusarium coffeatum]